jgi:arylsulfatase B
VTRREFLAATAAATASGAAPPPRRPNIVILLADDLGWSDVGFHGGEIRTPRLDRLAAESVRFDRFYSYPLCSPTRSALMTGRSPMRLGVVYATIEPFDDYGVPVEEHFLPQTLQAAGYQTAMCGKWHLGHRSRKYLPPARGFDRCYGHINGRIDYYTKDREGGYDWHRDLRTLREDGYSTDLIGKEAVRLIRTRDKARPLFLYVPFNAPHTPLQLPPNPARYPNIEDEARRVFAAMVTRMDDAIGGILDALEGEGMTRDTLVLFFSDNGGPTQFGARNGQLRGGKRSCFEGGIRVPAVMRWPGRLPAGTRCGQMVTVMDLFPTLASAAGVRPMNRLPFDGRDQWAAIAANRSAAREEDIFFGSGSDAKFVYAVFHQEWKLVREISRKNGSAVNLLFRIAEDPEEKRDLAAEHPQLVSDLAARIDGWRKLYPPDGIVDPKKDAPPGVRAPAQWAEAALP